MNDKPFTINENILKINGTVTLPKAVRVGHDYHLDLPVNCCAMEISNNENGTVDQTFRVKPTGDIKIVADYGEKILAKSRMTESQKLRNLLFYKYGKVGNEEEFQEWYGKIMEKIRNNIDKILNF